MTVSATEIEQARLSGDLPKATTLLIEAAAQNGGNLTLATGHQWALILQASKEWEKALDVLHLLRAKAPNNAQVALQLGQCYEILGQYIKAKDAFNLATELHAKDESQKDSCRAWFGLGSNLFRLGKPDEALEAWERGLTERCDGHDARFQRSHVRLAMGDFAGGWEDYEARKELQGYKASIRARGLHPEALPPEWDGKSEGRVLVYGTMGAGDCVMFSRYLWLVEEQANAIPRAVMGAPLEAWYGAQSLGGCDYSVALDSLPLVLNIHQPLNPDLAYESWRKPNNPKPRIGVCWEGSATHLGNHDRSSPIDFREAFKDPRWEIVSLQVGKGFQPKDYRETADLMATLDAVVTCDTSCVHVAGTLGVPTICIPPSSPEWRWQIKGETTPWYPSVRLVRRTRWDAWPEAIGRAKRLLEEML